MAISEEVLSEDQSDGRPGREHGRQQDQWMWILFTLEQIAAKFLCFSYLIKSTQQGPSQLFFTQNLTVQLHPPVSELYGTHRIKAHSVECRQVQTKALLIFHREHNINIT